MNARDPMIIHYATDMNRAVAFYRDVFDVAVEFESPGWSTLAMGSFTLAPHILFSGHHDEVVLPNAGLNLLVDSIEMSQKRIESSGGVLRELREPDSFVPVRVASFYDSEGNGFELRQEVA